jgi:ADP-ribose pyrophosphatase
MQPKKVAIKHTRRLYDGFFKVDQATLQFERFDGSMSPDVTRYNFNRGDSVCVLLHNPQADTLILINQFRYPAYINDGPGWLLELPAGSVSPGEAPDHTARRELIEEVGYQVEELEPVITIYPSPGGTSERIYIYYARISRRDRKTPGGGLSTEHEDIQTVEIPIKEAFEMLREGRLMDAKTIVALQWLALRSHSG